MRILGTCDMKSLEEVNKIHVKLQINYKMKKNIPQFDVNIEVYIHFC